jgi:hypothetical protein
VGRLGQRECADRLQTGHAGQPPPPLGLSAEHRDRAHGQSRLDPEERAETAITPVELHVDQALGYRAHPVTHELQLGQPLNQRPGELGPLPVPIDDGQHFLVDEVAGPPPGVELGRCELTGDVEVVGAQ